MAKARALGWLLGRFPGKGPGFRLIITKPAPAVQGWS